LRSRAGRRGRGPDGHDARDQLEPGPARSQRDERARRHRRRGGDRGQLRRPPRTRLRRRALRDRDGPPGVADRPGRGKHEALGGPRGAASAQPMSRAVLAALLSIPLGACGSDQAQAPQTITVRSAAFAPGGAIPRIYTCNGRNISLPLKWSGIPAEATELRLTMIDPDAPGGGFIHWQLSGLSPRSTGLE